MNAVNGHRAGNPPADVLQPFSGSSVDRIASVEQMLAEVHTAADAAVLVGYAEAARVWAKQAKLGTASVNQATAIKLKAERRMADLVDAGQANGDIATKGKPKSPHHGDYGDTHIPATLAELGIDDRRLAEARIVRDRYTDEQIDELIVQATAEDITVARLDFLRRHNRIEDNSGNNEWYTPPYIIAAAKRVMGDIDLDPASCVSAQRTVMARRYYTKAHDGLDKPWTGRVWLNPPYEQPTLALFITKLLHEVSAGRTSEALVLTNNSTDTICVQDLLLASRAVCFPRGRVRFLDSQGGFRTTPLQGQLVAYIGSVAGAESFAEVFSDLGVVARITK